MTLEYLSSEKLNVKNHLAVIPCGSLMKDRETRWTEEELKYYVSYVINGQSLDRMFGGLIFNPIVGRAGRFIHPLYTAFGYPVERKDWLEAIHYLFRPGENIRAAEKVAFEPIDIWVAIPYPEQTGNYFGKVFRRPLSFRLEDDRFLAAAWWIDEFIKRWYKEKLALSPRLTFRGFVWQREGIHEVDENLVKRVNEHIKQRGYLSLWLTNYGGVGMLNAYDYGFDACCVSPNYYGNTPQDYQWINNTCLFTREYNMGIQINYGRGMLFDENHLVDYLNLGLPQYNDYLQNSLVVYQFHQTTMKEAYLNSTVDYIRLYSGIKGLYTKVDYPGIPY